MTPVLADHLPDITAAPAPDQPPRFRAHARYQIAGVTRVLCTRVANGQVVLFDMPADQFDGVKDPVPGNGSYLVEPHLGGDRKELKGLIADYLQQVELHQRVPMTMSALDEVLDTRPR
jgi:hypothetical protein